MTDHERILLSKPLGEGYEPAIAVVKTHLYGYRRYWDRTVGIRAALQAARAATPEIFSPRRLRILEIGPGVGHWLEVADATGNDAIGIDRELGSPLTDAYEQITRAVGVTVRYGSMSAVRELSPGFDLIACFYSLDGLVRAAGNGGAASAVGALAGLLSVGGAIVAIHNADGLRDPIIRALEACPGLSTEKQRETTGYPLTRSVRHE